MLRGVLWARGLSRKVPGAACGGLDLSKLPAPTRVDGQTIRQLEAAALVQFGTEEGIQVVEEAIRFADQLALLDTTPVQPIYSVLEDRSLPLREDEVTEVSEKEAVLGNSKLVEEDYFVAPPGNIPLEASHYAGREEK